MVGLIKKSGEIKSLKYSQISSWFTRISKFNNFIVGNNSRSSPISRKEKNDQAMREEKGPPKPILPDSGVSYPRNHNYGCVNRKSCSNH